MIVLPEALQEAVICIRYCCSCRVSEAIEQELYTIGFDQVLAVLPERVGGGAKIKACHTEEEEVIDQQTNGTVLVGSGNAVGGKIEVLRVYKIVGQCTVHSFRPRLIGEVCYPAK